MVQQKYSNDLNTCHPKSGSILIPDFYVHDIQVIIAVTLMSGSECWIWSKCHFCLVFYLNVHFTPNSWGTIFWPNQDDRMNVTEKFVHDRKDHTHKHERLKLTEKERQRRKWTVEYDQINELKATLEFQSYSWVFRSCSAVYVCRCNLSVNFHRSCLSVWSFFGHILTVFWSYWFGQTT